MKIKLVGGYSVHLESAVIAVAAKLVGEGHHVEVVYPRAIEGLPEEIAVVQDLSLLSDPEDSFFIPLSPEVVVPLKNYFSKHKLKRLLGSPEPLTHKFVTDKLMAKSFLRSAGAPVVDFVEGNQDPLRLCYWIAGDHCWPVAFCWDRIEHIVPGGGPFDFRGISVVPCWSKKIATFGDHLRLTCAAVRYSGPVFVDLVQVPETREIAIQNVSFSYPDGFLLAMMDVLADNQKLGFWFDRLAKGLPLDVRVRSRGAAFLTHVSQWRKKPGIDWQVYAIEDSAGPWVYPITIRYDDGFNYPKIEVTLDGGSVSQYTLSRLSSRKINVYATAGEESETQKENEEVLVSE